MRRPVAAGLAMLLFAGCGRFASSDRADDAPVTETIGDATDLAPATTATTSPQPGSVASTTTSAVDTTTAPTGPTTVPVANAATATTDGLEVTVVAENGPSYPSRPDFRIEVTVTNRSDRTRYRVVDQGDFAAMSDGRGDLVWTSTDCNTTLDVYETSGGTVAIEPGEQVRVVVRYPQPERDGDLGCSLPDGLYTLYGQFPICPDEALEETVNPGTYTCPDESVQMVVSGGLALTFGAG